ncbi:MAG: acyl-ACP--UDP-N-acetylglucosamine O-acyltransferase, partial [Bryobacteraceae bacterium]
MSKAVIDSSARIEAGAAIGQGVSIGPYCVVGPHVVIGEGCRLYPHVHITGHTTIGPRTVIYPFASLGTPPQSVHYKGGPTKLVVGADCDIREHVTMNIGTEQDRGVTQVGDHCFVMVGSH